MNSLTATIMERGNFKISYYFYPYFTNEGTELRHREFEVTWLKSVIECLRQDLNPGILAAQFRHITTVSDRPLSLSK